jgi:hypothetical protein
MVAFPQKRWNLLYGTPCRMDAPGSTIQIWTKLTENQPNAKGPGAMARPFHEEFRSASRKVDRTFRIKMRVNLEVCYLFTVTAAPE